MDEWLPEKHLARFVVELIDGFDLRAMVGAYRGSGRRSILEPEAAAGDVHSVAFCFIAANDHPDHHP